jgi:hypothetical protein
VHPARHRALRELGALTSQLASHWDGLAKRVDEPVLAEGAAAAREILAELRLRSRDRGVVIGPAALGAGRAVSARPSIPDVLLERNQALRFAVLDVQHVVTLIGYLGTLSASDGDEDLRVACAAWNTRLRELESRARVAAVTLGTDPDAAIAPLSAGAKLGYAIGWLGEATDRLAGRRGRG